MDEGIGVDCINVDMSCGRCFLTGGKRSARESNGRRYGEWPFIREYAIARNLKEAGVSKSLIVQCIGLSEEKIERL